MNGLEIAEVLLSELNKEMRIDSEYFKKNILKYENTIKNYKKLKELGTFLVGPFGSTVTADTYVEDSDCSYIRGVDIGNFFLTDSDAKIAESRFQELSKFHVKENDIFITVVGTLGKVAINTNPKLKAIFSCKSTIVRTKEINPFLLTTFLSTPLGQEIVLRGKRGAIQEGLNITDLQEIKVPAFDDNFQLHIEHLVKSAYQKLEESKKLYAEAEALLLTELNLINFAPSNESVSIKSFSESFGSNGRLDSEYYQPKYDEIIARIKSYKGGFELTSEHFEQNKTTYQRVKENYNYIEIGDVNVSNGEINFNIVPTEELPDNAKIKVSKGDVLISKVRPYRGAVGIIEVEDGDLICSGAFTVLRENGRINKETLVTLFRLSFYKELLLKYNVGTSYPVIKDEDVLNIPIPLIDENTQKIIAEKISKSFTLRTESKQLLEEAKTAVERVIEEGENL